MADNTQLSTTSPIFSPSNINSQTPPWANAAAFIVSLLTTVAIFVIASDPGIPDELKVRLGIYLKGFDMFVLGLSKFFKISEVEEITSSTK